MMPFSRANVAIIAALTVTASALEVDWQQDHTYSVIHKGKNVFSAFGGVAVFADDQWYDAKSGSLKFVKQTPMSGTDSKLGKYSGVEVSWTFGAGSTFVTTSKNFDDGVTVTFTQSWPQGATKTSLVVHNASGPKSNQEVVANFPAFTNTTLPNTISWAGSFVGAQQNRGMSVTGPTGGPTVFFDSSDAAHSNVVVMSPLDNFKASSAGPGYTYDQSMPAYAPGTTGTVTSIPAGFSATYVLRAGATRGITAAIGEWGAMLQTYHSTYRVPDVTLEKIGYQTDNGAAYVFCRPPAPYKDCNSLLIAEIKQLKDEGVPMGYLSFQGAGSSTMLDDRAGPPSAPWCVNEWGPDLNETQHQRGQFPMMEKDFQKALGIPLQLYAPYFCPESKYFQRNNPSSEWIGVTSDTTLPGCSDYGFQDATPQESRKFYDWFFKKGIDVGMLSFEPDFMNQNYNCVPDFVESVSNSDMWQHGMTDAALAANLTVQWCYAAPTDVMNSLTMPALTNFRVSTDFCYGHSWDIGVSSLIVWAVGAFPSKDTLWTTDNGRFSVPGCPWGPDHENVSAPLHVVLSLMSTGPVGISDKIGMTNVSLIQRTISEDGTLLKPSKAITSIDSALSAGSGMLGDGPSGFVYSTYTGTLLDATSWIFVSFKMKDDFTIGELDFYPSFPKTTKGFVFRTFNDPACVNGAHASTCVSSAGSGNAILKAPKSDQTNVTGGTDYAPTVSTVWPSCPSGVVFLGDLRKYVAASSNRFKNVECTSDGVSYDIMGKPGEKVPVTIILANNTISEKVVVVSNSGQSRISY